MGRYRAAVLAIAGACALACIPAASAQAAGCGASWSVAPSFTSNDSFLFQASSDAAGDAMVAGYKYIINTAYRPVVLQWNGMRWTPMTIPGKGNEAILAGMAVNSSSSAVTVGYYKFSSSAPSRTFAEVWNGSSWSIDLPKTFKDGNTFLPSQLNHAASTSASNVWAVGFYISAGHVQIPVIEHYSSGAWGVSNDAPIGAGGTLTDVATDAPGDAWAVGSQNPTVSSQTPLTKHWNGSTWLRESAPSIGTFSELDGVSIVGPNDVWAVGESFNGSIDVPITMHWNGTKWSLVSAPNPSPNGSSLASVKALGSGDVWAFGTQRTDANGHSGPLIEHWNGTAWSVVPDSPDSPPAGDDGFLTGSTFTDGHVLAVGYTEPQGTSAGSTASQELCPLQVTDAGYTPPLAHVSMGTDARWSVLSSDTAGHSITDGDGTGLFDSGVVAPGGSFDFTFTAAGIYKLTDTPTGHAGKVAVPVTATPSSGAITDTYTVTWATAAPPTGYVFDTEIKRPGDGGFAHWREGQTASGTSFVPDHGTGTYAFRSRLRLSSDLSTVYSPPATITVS